MYDLGYDNQVQPTEKYDAENTFKKTYGYQPGIASINIPRFGTGNAGIHRGQEREQPRKVPAGRNT